MIAKLRREYGVNAPGRATNRWTPEVLARLGREPDMVIARELGISRKFGALEASHARHPGVAGRTLAQPAPHGEAREDQGELEVTRIVTGATAS